MIPIITTFSFDSSLLVQLGAAHHNLPSEIIRTEISLKVKQNVKQYFLKRILLQEAICQECLILPSEGWSLWGLTSSCTQPEPRNRPDQ